MVTKLAQGSCDRDGLPGGGDAPLEELASRGHLTVDTDDGQWTLPDGTWDEPRMTKLLASQQVEPLLRRGATAVLDARRPVIDLADDIESLLQ